MQEKIDIRRSEYGDEFIDSSVQYAFLYSKESSSIIWREWVRSDALSYFYLPNNHWLVSSKTVELGGWITDYNDQNPKRVQALLKNDIQWGDNDIIFFCMRQIEIIESYWIEFKQNWINFLSCEDDCPIIINPRFPNEAILFTPLGNILKIKADP